MAINRKGKRSGPQVANPETAAETEAETAQHDAAQQQQTEDTMTTEQQNVSPEAGNGEAVTGTDEAAREQFDRETDEAGQLNDEGDFAITGPAEVTFALNSALEKTFGNPVTMQITKTGKKQYIARFQPEAGGPVLQGDVKAQPNAAVKSLVTRSGYQGSHVIDVKWTEPAIGHNRPVGPKPWEDESDPETRDMLRAWGEEINKAIGDINRAEVNKRDAWLVIGRDVSLAYNKVQSWATDAKRGGVSLQLWGEYAQQYFPQFSEMGKNALAEARLLGAAPDEVIRLWPLSQNSAKAFDGWQRSSLNLFASYVVAHLLREHEAHKIAHAKEPQADATPLPCPGDKEVKEAIPHALETCERLVQQSIRANASESKVAEIKAIVAVGTWRSADLPEPGTEQFKKHPLVKAIERQLTDAYLTYKAVFDTKAAEDRVRRETEGATQKLVEAFADKPAEVAARHLYNILVSHKEPETVLEILTQLIQQRQEKSAEGEETAADEADADMTPEGM